MPSNSEQKATSVALDATDLLILEHLQRDASVTNQQLAEQVFTSPPTCLRRVKRLKDAGLIERQVAILSADKLGALLGHGLTALIEITLERQDAGALAAFEARMLPAPEVQQCYQVATGPDFILVVQVRDMPGYHALTERLFTTDANVRNVKTFFSLKRGKFAPGFPVVVKTS